MPEWLTTLITFAAGSLLALFSGWVSDRRSAQRDREARDEGRRDAIRLRRDDFQRETLLGLQDAARRLLRGTATAMEEKLKGFQETGEWQSQDWNTQFMEEFRRGTEDLRLLATRVRDEEVRTLAGDFRRRCGRAIGTNELEALQTNLISITDGHTLLIERAGDLIRQLDELD